MRVEIWIILLCILEPRISFATGGEEDRCTELGSACDCSEQLNSSSWNPQYASPSSGGTSDPPDSNAKECSHSGATDGTGAIYFTGGSDTDSMAAEVAVGTAGVGWPSSNDGTITHVFQTAYPASTQGIRVYYGDTYSGGGSANISLGKEFSGKTLCMRYYRRWDTTWPSGGDTAGFGHYGQNCDVKDGKFVGEFEHCLGGGNAGTGCTAANQTTVCDSDDCLLTSENPDIGLQCLWFSGIGPSGSETGGRNCYQEASTYQWQTGTPACTGCASAHMEDGTGWIATVTEADRVSLQECRGHWCRIEECFDHNSDSDNKLHARMRVTQLDDAGQTLKQAVYGTVGTTTSDAQAFTGFKNVIGFDLPDWIGHNECGQTTGSGDEDMTGNKVWVSSILSTIVSDSDEGTTNAQGYTFPADREDFWPGPAYEIEGGAPEEPPPPTPTLSGGAALSPGASLH